MLGLAPPKCCLKLSIWLNSSFWNKRLTVPEIPFHLETLPAVRWMGHNGNLFPDILGISTLSSIMVVLVYIPTNSILGYLIPYILSSTLKKFFWGDNYSNCGEVKPHCGFNCPWKLFILTNFSYVCWPSEFDHLKMPFHVLCHFLTGLFCCCWVS